MRRALHYERALPHELEREVKRFPVAYVPLGSLEWHSYHLPLGTDALKAGGILEHVAEKFGGVVLPPVYWASTSRWHPWSFDDFGADALEMVCRHIFTNLAAVGFKVIVGVTGHDVAKQIEAMNRALEATKQRYHVDGLIMMEGDLSDFGEHRMDHAGHWETAITMYLHPELVDMVQLEGIDLDGRISMDEWGSPGIGGRDPRGGTASRDLGRRLVLGIADAIGERATAFLQSVRAETGAASDPPAGGGRR